MYNLIQSSTGSIDVMSHFDLRFGILVMINILKSQTAKPWEWDPFDVGSDITWIKFWLLAIFLFIFSFVSIGIPLTTVLPNNVRYIQKLRYWAQAILSLAPDFSIWIMTTNRVDEAAIRELHGEDGLELEEPNLEEGRTPL
ncbi:UNVERIFIED_CONTAM: hypothetical protein Scaly_2373400 [Sesamum calycinum]|uniref:Uncharacterized protein n=1 Tax=Sesamum calycinum TaxID=2727403 RepID=A0AAW2LYZ3_9LAMI